MNRFIKITAALFFVCLLSNVATAQNWNNWVEAYKEKMGLNSSFNIGHGGINPPSLGAERHFKDDTTISSPLHIIPKGQIIVEAGVKLTIKNVNLGMPPGYYITVMPGGELVLENVLITNVYTALNNSTRWKGIFVGGTKSDDFRDQGIVIMTDVTIENAETGVTTMERVDNAITPLTEGGRVRATRSVFKNNIKDLDLIEQNFYYWGHSFTMCDFIVDRNLNMTTSGKANFDPGIGIGTPQSSARKPRTRADLQEVIIEFNGCTFQESLLYPDPTDTTYAIVSVGGNIRIDNYCYQPGGTALYPCPDSCKIRSSFTDFRFGIESDGGIISIKNSDFVNNKSGGATIHNVNYLAVQGCDVLTGSEYKSYGLYLRNCKYYKVENSDFAGQQNGSNGVGIYVAYSGKGIHKIYRNNFNGLLLGIAPIANNSDVSNFDDGLKMNCNYFSNCSYNIAMIRDPEQPNIHPSVAYYQGYAGNEPKKYVRNRYGVHVCGMQNKWHIDDGAINKVYHASFSGEVYSPIPQPSCSDPAEVIVVEQGNPQNGIDVYCPDEVNTGTTERGARIEELEEAIAASQSVTDREVEIGLNYYLFELHSLISEEIRAHFELATEEGYEDAMNLIVEYEHDNTLANIDLLISQGALGKAQTLLSQFAQNPLYYDFYQRRSLMIQYKQALANKQFVLANALLLQVRNYVLPISKPLPTVSFLKDAETDGKAVGLETFKVYPVPAQEMITFEYYTEEVVNVVVELQNIAGQVVDRFELRSSQYQYPVSNLEQGIYLATLKVDGKKVATEKVIILK